MSKYPEDILNFVETIHASCKEAGMSIEKFQLLAEALTEKSQGILTERKQQMLAEKL